MWSTTRHPATAAVVGGGSLFALDLTVSGKRIDAHREAGGNLHAYVTLTEPLDWFATVDFTDPAAATARIAREFDGWVPELTLGLAIAAHAGDIEAALAAYERLLFPRSAEHVA